MLVFPVKQGRGGGILWSSCCITLSWTLVFPVKQDDRKGGGGGIFWPTCCILISCLLALPPKQSNSRVRGVIFWPTCSILIFCLLVLRIRQGGERGWGHTTQAAAHDAHAGAEADGAWSARGARHGLEMAGSGRKPTRGGHRYRGTAQRWGCGWWFMVLMRAPDHWLIFGPPVL